MSKATLTSINKPHADNIFSEDETRKKTVEWRTKPLPRGLHYVYETKNKGGCGKVIGEMTIVENIKYADVSAIPPEMILKGRVGARQLDIYSKGKPLYANVITNAKRHDKPKELGEFYARCGDRKMKCDGCKYKKQDSWFDPPFCEVDGYISVKRPPQSYCFVESL